MNYEQYKRFHYLLEIENTLERILSRDIKNIIFQYIEDKNSGILLENNESICRLKLEGKSLKIDSYDKTIKKWSLTNITFAFSYNNGLGAIETGNIGIGTTVPGSIIITDSIIPNSMGNYNVMD